MSTHEQRQRARKAYESPTVRVSIDDLLKRKVSMIGAAMLPAEYNAIDNVTDVIEKFTSERDTRIARVHIVWDNEIGNFPLENVLDTMRETGAAMVVRAEEVKT